MEEKFKIGQKVRLISGGPVMTVGENIKTKPITRGDQPKFTEKVNCSWFDNQNVPQWQVYHQDMLELEN